MQQSQIHYTVEEYWRLVEAFPEKRLEYVDGNVRDMHVLNMTGGSNNHAQIGNNINRFVANRLDEAGSECIPYSSDIKVQLSASSYYHPDLVVSCNPRDWGRTNYLESPNLVIEVLSPGTESIDKNEKLSAYKKYPTIREILLINSRKWLVIYYSRLSEISWRETLFTGRHDRVHLEHLEIELPLQEIYYRVALDPDRD